MELEGHEWAQGCRECEFGLIGEVAEGRKVDVPLFIFRVYQAKEKRIEFCTCRAGQQYRNRLRRIYDDIQNGKEEITSAYHDKIAKALDSSAVRVPTATFYEMPEEVYA
jgi:hypothetical protein